MKKILVGIDGSEVSFRGIKLACDIASSTGARVTIAYAMVPIVPDQHTDLETAALSQKHERQWAERILEEGAETASEYGVQAETITLGGPAAEALTDFAVAQKFDLVVVGNKGRGAVAKALIGSVADRLAHLCNRPVLIVR